MLTSSLCFSLLFSAAAFAAPTVEKRTTYPFKRIVAFGDNLSDNGNGSYAWCIADYNHCTNSIYGYKTWTDGPVAVSYLSTLLGMPLSADFAIGHANGGAKFGATVDNNYTLSPAGVPSAIEQIANYTTNATLKKEISTTLHFLWVGENDINLDHINVGKSNNSAFATGFSERLYTAVEDLVAAGAKYIFVPNLVPKQIAPQVKYLATTATQVTNLGLAVDQANTAIEAKLKPFGKKVLYYDVNTFMLKVWNNNGTYGITHEGGQFCDGYSSEDWTLCVTDKEGDTFYWMQYLDMTSYVHDLIATAMHKAIAAHTW